MSDLLITRLPTLVNIDTMDLSELREQYKRLEGETIDQAQQLSDACAQLATMIRTIKDYNITFATLCDSYEAGDQAALLLMAKRLSEKRAAFHAKQKARVH